MARALPALLAGLVDYAGLFPPAALEMADAVARFAAYRAGPQRAMLGRFVVPTARLDEFSSAAAGGSHLVSGDPWRLSVLAGADDATHIARFNAAHGGRAVIDTIEARAADLQTIWQLATTYDASFTVYVEIPVADDPSALVAELAARGLRAKIRTGGVTADAIPPSAHVLRFLATCARHGVPLKATAGLHHPLRGEYALTYAADSARGTMYGFLNVFLAAALLYDGMDESEVAPLLEERDPAAFRADGDTISWRDHSLTVDEIVRARADFAGSFGSCSFEEPVQDLAALRMLPAMLSS